MGTVMVLCLFAFVGPGPVSHKLESKPGPAAVLRTICPQIRSEVRAWAIVLIYLPAPGRLAQVFVMAQNS